MHILWIDPIGSDVFRIPTLSQLNLAKRNDTTVDFVSLPPDRPHHLEYLSYEALVMQDIVRLVALASTTHDAAIIGCFFDVGLHAAREISGQTIVTAPCESAAMFARQLGNSFSVLAGRRKWIPRIRENLIRYGHDHALASIRSLDADVYDFLDDSDRVMEKLLAEGRRAIEEDGAEVLVLGCTADIGSFRRLQEKLGVPVIDSVVAPLKHAELLVETAVDLGWRPSRQGSGEPPPAAELEQWLRPTSTT